jgi:hypothetical protein
MDDMKESEDRITPIEEALMAAPTEASLRVQVTDLLLDGLRDVRIGRLTWSRAMSCNESKRRWKPTGATSTQPSTANEAVTVPQAIRRPDEDLMPGTSRILEPQRRNS